MDTVRANHITFNGPGLWHILHRMAFNANNQHNKSLFQEFLLVFQQALTCQVCLLEFTTFLQHHPLANYDNILYENYDIGYFKWSVDLHNHVNIKLGKPLVSLTAAYKYYTTQHHNCKSCIKLE